MSGIVAFFGHRDVMVTGSLEHKLEEVVQHLILDGYREFWCCDQGNFDWVSRIVMRRMKKRYPDISLCCLCAYNPNRYSKLKQDFWFEDFDFIYPAEAAYGPQKFAILRRNKYIVEHADVFVCYVTRQSGGAYRALNLARQKGKRIFNLAESCVGIK